MITRRERIAQAIEKRRWEVWEWYKGRGQDKPSAAASAALDSTETGWTPEDVDPSPPDPKDIKGQLRLF